MLKKMLLRKIAVVTSLLLIMLMLYIIPTNKEELELTQKLEYIYPNDLSVIYLLNDYDYLSLAKVSASTKDEISKAADLIEALTIDGKKTAIIPNGFRQLLPKNTKVLDLDLKDKILTINFSKEFNNIQEEYEEKLIESLIYTLTNINGIDKIIIKVEGKELTNLPNSKKRLPAYLDKNYGINKKYELASLSNIDSYTIYYVFNLNNEVYYTPVTKYVNNQNQDKIKIIINELASSLIYESNLMSYLDTNVKLLDYEKIDNVIKLNFNELILSDITNNLILEEVMYTIGLSLYDEYDIDKVIFYVNNREIATFSPKTLALK